MDLEEYFTTRQGTGILSTADRQGEVDAAIYARPHPQADGTLAMIMRDRLTHRNLLENPHAVYLFIADLPGYQGVRIYLRKVREDADPELLAKLTRRSLSKEEDLARGPKFIVYFEVVRVRPLVS